MALDSIRLSATILASPDRVYAAWLNAAEHSKMTGSKATFEPEVGGKHTAWDNYISGTNLVLETGKRIVQTWRATDFPAGADDSNLEVLFEPTEDGNTLVTVIHTELAQGMGDYLTKGWNEFYFKPMKAYFKKVAPAKKSAAKAREESFGRSPRRKLRRSPRRKASKKPVKKASKKPAKKASKKPVKKASKKPAKKASKKPAKKASKEAREESFEEAGQEGVSIVLRVCRLRSLSHRAGSL